MGIKVKLTLTHVWPDIDLEGQIIEFSLIIQFIAISSCSLVIRSIGLFSYIWKKNQPCGQDILEGCTDYDLELYNDLHQGQIIGFGYVDIILLFVLTDLIQHLWPNGCVE
jgi:hypothetical protein